VVDTILHILYSPWYIIHTRTHMFIHINVCGIKDRDRVVYNFTSSPIEFQNAQSCVPREELRGVGRVFSAILFLPIHPQGDLIRTATNSSLRKRSFLTSASSDKRLIGYSVDVRRARRAINPRHFNPQKSLCSSLIQPLPPPMNSPRRL
jgi:hypothetical protein